MLSLVAPFCCATLKALPSQADAVPAAATRETAETCRDAIPNTDTKLVTLTNPVTLWFVSDTAPVMPSAVTKL